MYFSIIKGTDSANSISIRSFLIKTFFIVLGSACVIGGSLEMASQLLPPYASHTVEAVVIGRRTACVLEYQLSDEAIPRREAMACDHAEAFVLANPGRHAHMERHDLVRVRYTALGGMREAEARIMRPGRLPPAIGPGASLTVSYALRNPADVRIAASLSSLTDLIFLIGLGLVTILITIFGTGAPPRTPKAFPIRSKRPGMLKGLNGAALPEIGLHAQRMQGTKVSLVRQPLRH